MAAVHGKNGRVYIEGFDMSCYMNSANLDTSVDVSDITVFCDNSKRYLEGLKDATFAGDGVYDDDVDTLDTLINDIKGVNAVYSYYPALDTKGNIGYGFESIRTAANIAVSITEHVNFSLAAQGDDGVDRIVSITPKVLIDEDGSTTSLDLGVGGNGTTGGVLYVHITDITGTVTVVVEDSADNTTWATLHSVGAVSAVDGLRVALTGNIDRYIRVTVSAVGIGEDITIQAGITVN